MRTQAAIAATTPRTGDPLPLQEFLHPVCVVALLILIVNDHFLKGAGILPWWITGKLSDVAGIVFFPLLLTAAANTTAYFVNKATRIPGMKPLVDHHLRTWKLVTALLFTTVIFASIQLSETAVTLYTTAVSALGFPAVVTMDPTDLVALLVLPIPYLIGMKVVRGKLLS